MNMKESCPLQCDVQGYGVILGMARYEYEGELSTAM
jgi:hypothetical protein